MVGELIAGRYELAELVGSGGMSSVFRAHDRILDRDVALKVLHEQYSSDDEYVERFRSEARAVAQLAHANIVTVIDRGEQDGRQFIVFEYVDGENLKQLVGRVGPLPVREALNVAIQAGSGLAFAHKQGLVHRDVKPQNVLVNPDGRARVTDFGIARQIDVEHGLTQTGSVLGTAGYISPEQARGQRVDALSDVYSLGAVLFELLTGEMPFDGENFVAVAMKHVHEPPPSVVARRPDVPLRVDAAVQRAMAKLPEDRFASMDEFVRELRACLVDLGPDVDIEATLVTRGPPVVAESKRHDQRAHRIRRRTWLLLLLVALAVLVAIAVGALLVRSDVMDRHSAGTTTGVTTTTPATTPSVPVTLTAVGSYDPRADGGDGNERDDTVPLATDGNAETGWQTESYHYPNGALGSKPGVGIVLDAGKPASPKEVTVLTQSPGFDAVIEAGDSKDGPFRRVWDPKETSSETTFPLHDGTNARYFVVWITKLSGERAYVNEVTAR